MSLQNVGHHCGRLFNNKTKLHSFFFFFIGTIQYKRKVHSHTQKKLN